MAKCGFSLSSERILPGVFIGVFIGVFTGVFTGVFNGLDSARSAPLPPNCGGAECFSPQLWGSRMLFPPIVGEPNAFPPRVGGQGGRLSSYFTGYNLL